MTVANYLGAHAGSTFTVQPHVAIAKAIRRMKLATVPALVVTSEVGQVLGVISEEDFARGLVDYGPGVLKMQVGDLMTWTAIACSPQDSLRDLAAWMTNECVRYLPVLDGDRLCGLVSVSEVVGSVL